MATFSDPSLTFQFQKGVYISPNARQRFADFENAYLQVRQKEGRVLDVEQIRNLPYVKGKDEELWILRRKNISRFIKYLQKKEAQLKILEVGCGNGFFSHLISQQGHQVTGIDVNLPELEMAAAAFGHNTIKWMCVDIINEKPFDKEFDLVVFCAAFQYFEFPDKVINKCLEIIKPGGEIHIIDSPFYRHANINKARQSSRRYFEKQGVSSMHAYFFHHPLSSLKRFNAELMYRPSWLKIKLLMQTDSPLPWIRIRSNKA